MRGLPRFNQVIFISGVLGGCVLLAPFIIAPLAIPFQLLAGEEVAFVFFGLATIAAAVLIVWLTGAWSIELWEKVEHPKGMLAFILGHLAMAATGYLTFQMYKAGQGSGLLLLPTIALAALCYLIGLIRSVTSLRRERE